MTITAIMTRPIANRVNNASNDLRTVKFWRSVESSCRDMVGVVFGTWPISLCFSGEVVGQPLCLCG